MFCFLLNQSARGAEYIGGSKADRIPQPVDGINKPPFDCDHQQHSIHCAQRDKYSDFAAISSNEQLWYLTSGRPAMHDKHHLQSQRRAILLFYSHCYRQCIELPSDNHFDRQRSRAGRDLPYPDFVPQPGYRHVERSRAGKSQQ